MPRDDDYAEEIDDAPRERRPRRRGFECRYCGSLEQPVTREQISVGGWIVFAVLVFACAPLCWIGLLMKEEVYHCYECGRKVGS
ncbi:MAG: LITAF-like zinc ribbon domain-containing protein [Gemmataceae bacterium]|nr:LITAF-like zinc ribbon domain-containing protein [Gemmataceae bacterium]